MSGDRMSADEEDSFLEEESSSKREEDLDIPNRRCSPQSPPFELEDDNMTGNKDSFVTALENPGDLSSPPPLPPEEDVPAVACMSTIEEESRSYHTSTTGASVSKRLLDEDKEEESYKMEGIGNEGHIQYRDLNQSQEFRDIQQLVAETAEELKDKSEHEKERRILQVSNDSTVDSQPLSRSLKDDEGLDALLLKLEKLESAQNVLEEALNAGESDNIDIDQLIAQLPLDSEQLLPRKSKKAGGNANGEEDLSQRSFSSEIASIQKIIDGADMSFSVNLGVAGGNSNNLQSTTEDLESEQEENAINSVAALQGGQRSVEDVLKEYEEFERSLSRATAVDESFRSDISSVPQLSNYSNPDPVKTIPDTVLLSPIKTSTQTNHLPAQSSVPVQVHSPVIKPPVLKATVPAPSQSTLVPPPNNKSQMYQSGDVDGSSSRTRPMTSNPKNSSRLGSQSAHGFQQQINPQSQSARTTASSTATMSGRHAERDANALNKGRNRRMRSPRTVTNSPGKSNDSFAAGDIPNNLSTRGGGEGYKIPRNDENNSPRHRDRTHHHQHNTSKNKKEKMDTIVATEALKTIEKLNTMVARQETLLDAFTKDNEKLWKQLKEAKNESQEKEAKFQDVINSLKTEVATLKLNRLVTNQPPSPPSSPIQHNRIELKMLREDSELKSHQILELRKEILLLQNKLASRTRSPSKPKQLPKEQNMSQEKEKEFQKTIDGLNKQVRTLQRILYSREESAPPPPPSATVGKSMQRTKSDLTRENVGPNVRKVQQQQRKSLRNCGMTMTNTSGGLIGKKVGGAAAKSVNIKTGDVLQASLNCIEQEREEFESIIAEKNKLIFEKERIILNLKEEVEILKSKIPEGESIDPGIVNELRSRIIAQNQVIQTLKQHMSTFKKLETENLLLREEKRSLEKLGKDLRRKLEFAQSLVKPENEVLCVLSEKVDELNSRYYQRERQLDSLLNKLTVKTTTVGGELTSGSSSSNDSTGGGGRYMHSANLSPRRRLPLDQFNNNNGSLGGFQVPSSSIGGKGRSTGLTSADILHMVDISPPSNSFENFDTDLPDM